MRKNNLLLLLALLMTAATGAWADETPKVVFEEHFVSEPNDPTAVGFYEFINFEEGDDHEVDNGELSIFNSDGTLDINNWKRRAIKFRNLPLGEGKTYRLEFKLKGSTRFEDGINDGDDRPFCKASAQLLQGVEGHDISLLDSDGNEQRGEFENFDESNYKSYSMTFVFASEQKQKDTYALNNQGELAEKYYLSLSIFNPGFFYLKDVVLYEIPSAASGYTVSLKDGVKDADKWTISPNPAEEGQTVTLQYNGRLKVKGVTATSDEKPAAPAGPPSWKLTLSSPAKDLYITANGGLIAQQTLDVASTEFTVEMPELTSQTVNIVATDGSGNCWYCTQENMSFAIGQTYQSSPTMNAVGTSSSEAVYKMTGAGTIPAGKTAVLSGVTFSSTISCSGDATIILMGNNTLNGGLQASPLGNTVTITGTGSLNAHGSDYNPGIGAFGENNCGNIIICGGNITAQAGSASNSEAAGIGSGEEDEAICGNITICGGTVTATGGKFGAGIGSGNTNCGTVTITDGATKVTATKGSKANNSIGKGSGSCGTVTIDGVVNATTSSTFEHFNSAVSGSTWTLTHK